MASIATIVTCIIAVKPTMLSRFSFFQFHETDGIIHGFTDSKFNPESKTFSLEFTRQDARNGNLVAQCGLGMYLLNHQDDDAGFKWLRQAANAGYAEAQYQLACYGYFCVVPADGHSHPVTADEALKWVILAAEQGHPEALWQKATCYRYGDCGLKQDIKEAVKWYRRAAEAGNPWAKDALKELGQ